MHENHNSEMKSESKPRPSDEAIVKLLRKAVKAAGGYVAFSKDIKEFVKEATEIADGLEANA